MKKMFLILLLLMSVAGVAQTVERVIINGQISVPPGDDPEGITIINVTTNRGTVSDEKGQFQISVTAGDVLSFSALQFEEFTVVIHQNVVEARQLNVFVSEVTTELPEVVVSPIDLSGNVEVDVRRIPVTDVNIPDISREDVYDASLRFKPGELTSPENAAMRDRFMKNGLDFINIFKAIVSAEDYEDMNFQPIDEEIRKLYNDEFFREYLAIERSQISNFILFAKDRGLTKKMLEEGNELELVEFLIRQSDEFKAQLASE